jgi:hypothetical protein
MSSDGELINRTTIFAGAASFALLIAAGFAETKEAHRAPPCDVDCVSRDAGYAWGKELGINDPTECGGKSKEFIDGCQAYANEHLDPMALPADDAQSDQASDEEQDKLDGFTVDDKVNALTGPSADPDDNDQLPNPTMPNDR